MSEPPPPAMKGASGRSSLCGPRRRQTYRLATYFRQLPDPRRRARRPAARASPPTSVFRGARRSMTCPNPNVIGARREKRRRGRGRRVEEDSLQRFGAARQPSRHGRPRVSERSLSGRRPNLKASPSKASASPSHHLTGHRPARAQAVAQDASAEAERHANRPPCPRSARGTRASPCMRLLSRGWRWALATRGFARRKIARARARRRPRLRGGRAAAAAAAAALGGPPSRRPAAHRPAAAAPPPGRRRHHDRDDRRDQ